MSGLEEPLYGSVLDILIRAGDEPDQLTKQNLLRIGQILATEHLCDAVKECTATLKEVTGREIDAVQALDRTLQKATNAVVVEMRKATVRQVA